MVIQWIAIRIRRIRKRKAAHCLCEIVHFLTFESGAQLKGIINQTKGAGKALRLECVGRTVEIANRPDLPISAKVVGQIRLNIREIGYVFALHVKAAKQVFGGFVTRPNEVTKCPKTSFVWLPTSFQMRRSTQHTRAGTGPQTIGTFIFDVQHRGEFVAILGLKTTARKGEIAYKVNVRKGQTLLLSGADELRAVNLKIIDVHEVFVVVAAAHLVLRTQFAARAHVSAERNMGQHAFQIAGGTWQEFQVGHVFFLHHATVVEPAPAYYNFQCNAYCRHG